MKKIALFALILLVPALVLAQGERTLTRNLWENLRVTSVENMKACNASSLGSITIINDGDTATDCTTGDGEEIVICQCDGSAWAAVVPATPDLDFVALAPGFEGELCTFDGDLGEITGSSVELSVIVQEGYPTVAIMETPTNTTFSLRAESSIIMGVDNGNSMFGLFREGVAVPRYEIYITAGDNDNMQLRLDDNGFALFGEGATADVNFSATGVVTGATGLQTAAQELPTCNAGAAGKIIFEAVTTTFCGCDGTAWVNLSTGGTDTNGECGFTPPQPPGE